MWRVSVLINGICYTLPDGFDKSQKLNLRRYASKSRVSICILKISGVEYVDGFIYLVYTEWLELPPFKSLWKPLFLGNAEDYCVVCSFAGKKNADESMFEMVKYNIKYVLCIINWLKNVCAYCAVSGHILSVPNMSMTIALYISARNASK